jgi:phenylalanyl-tRNA synthetase beta chain
MNISYNWLRDLTDVTLDARALAEKLTGVGLTVEGVHEAGDDFVLDIDLTSNRPDCLSHLGVAREVAVIEGGRVSVPQAASSRVEVKTSALTSIELRSEDLCPRYAARIVRGVQIAPSPDWMVKRLEAIGQRAINNVTDATNYVLHELGQPLHAFDFAKLNEGRIVVRRATQGEKIKTLDAVERELDDEMLVIADATRAVAVAGVMGGEETEISDATQDVLIESAYFAPASVRRTSRLLGLHTEASHRFERGVDYEGVMRAQERCVALICELAGGTATEDALDVYTHRIEPLVVSLRPSRVESLTGIRVEHDVMRRILHALGFSDAASDKNELMTFVAPTWRVDVEREEDLVEEVARHVGYDQIAAALPASNIAGEYQPSEVKKRAVGRALTAFGYDEAISFSFIDAAQDGRFELLPNVVSAQDGQEQFVTLKNSIIEGATRMRPTLLFGLLQALRHNLNHGTRDVRLFETGRIFAANAARGELPNEREALALVATGGAIEEGRAGTSRELDFYDLKGALEAAADAMGISSLRFKPARVGHLREGQSAVIESEGQGVIGTIGKLDDALAAMYKFRQNVFVAEVDFSALLQAEQEPVLYSPLARYPSVFRDVTLLVRRGVSLTELLDAVREQRVESCRDAKLVGVYEGAGVPEEKRSMTLRLEYRADDRTLRDEEVEVAHAQILQALEAKFNAQQRS